MDRKGSTMKLTKAQREALSHERFIVGSWAGDVIAPVGTLDTYVKIRRGTFTKLKELGLVHKQASSVGSDHYGLTESGRQALSSGL